MNFTCDICEKLFPAPIELKWHMNIDHGENETYICDICEKLFPTLTELKWHINIDHDETIYFKCDICEKGYKTKKHYGTIITTFIILLQDYITVIFVQNHSNINGH